MLDKQTEASDRRLANHIVSLYTQPANQDGITDTRKGGDQATTLVATNTIEKDFLARYISYARKHVQPSMNESVVDRLVEEYSQMRSMGNSKKTITATPRQLESMIRIAESLAKMRLSETVTADDVSEAVRLIRGAL